MLRDLAIAVVGILVVAALYAWWHMPVPAAAPALSAEYVGADFTIQYPLGWSVDSTQDITKFVIDPALAHGTNLSTDSYVGVGYLPAGVACADASSTDAAAGNRYEEWVYVVTTDPCLAVTYLIHYGVLENYPPGVVTPFDHEALLAEFDAIRRSLVTK